MCNALAVVMYQELTVQCKITLRAVVLCDVLRILGGFVERRGVLSCSSCPHFVHHSLVYMSEGENILAVSFHQKYCLPKNREGKILKIFMAEVPVHGFLGKLI